MTKTFAPLLMPQDSGDSHIRRLIRDTLRLERCQERPSEVYATTEPPGRRPQERGHAVVKP